MTSAESALLCGCVAAALLAPAAAAGQEQPQRTILKGDPAPVTSVAFSSAGSRVAAAGGRQVRVWNAATGDEVFHIERAASAVAFSGDGKRLVVAGRRGDPAIYDADGKQLLTIAAREQRVAGFPFPPSIVAVALGPDGRQLAVVGTVSKVGGPHGYPGGGAKTWDLESKQMLREYVGRKVSTTSRYTSGLSTVPTAVAFSPDGKLLAVGTAGAGGELPEPGVVHVWDVTSGKRLHTLHGRKEVVPGENHCAIAALAFSPDGKRLAWADSEGVVRVWDLLQDTTAYQLRGHRGWVRALAFSPGGNRLATGGDDGRVCVWDMDSGKRVQALEGGRLPLRAVAFSADGKQIEATGGTTSRFAPGIAGLIDQDAPPPRSPERGAGEILRWSITPDP